MKHSTLEAVLASVTRSEEFHQFVGRVYVPVLGDDSELVIETDDDEPSPLVRKCVEDCLELPRETTDAAGRGMLAMHRLLAEECGDLDVALDSVDEIWSHTRPWYVIVPDDQREERRILDLHLRADWETGHGVELVIRNGVDVLFVGNCGDAGSVEDVLTGRCGRNFAESSH